MGSAAEFIKMRDFLLQHRTDYEAAYRGFSWPKLENFNWALDYFDAIASGNHRTALLIAGEAGGVVKTTFAEMAERSNQVANFLRRLGVESGQRGGRHGSQEVTTVEFHETLLEDEDSASGWWLREPEFAHPVPLFHFA